VSLTNRHKIWHSLSPVGATPKLPPLDAARRLAPRRARLGDGLATSHRTRTASTASPLGAAAVTAQNAFDWLDPTSSVGVAASAQLDRHTSRSRDTTFTIHRKPASSGTWASVFGYSPPASTPKRFCLRGPDASHQSLQPTCCHENPVSTPLSGLGLAPFHPSRPSLLLRRHRGAFVLTGRPRRRRLAVAGFPDPEQRHGLTPRRQPSPKSPPFWGHSVSRATTRVGVVSLHEPDELAPDAPCRTP
jgi:hypothetical protein